MSNTRARWGYWSEGVCDSDYLTTKEAHDLLAELGIDDVRAQVPTLVDELREYIAEYWLDRQIELGPRPAEIRAALRKLQPKVAALMSTIDLLDEGTRRLIMRGYRVQNHRDNAHPENRQPGDPGCEDLQVGEFGDPLGVFTNSLRMFEAAVENADMLLTPGEPGPVRLDSLRTLATQLARVHEQWTGKKWTYDQPVNRRSEHMSPSPGARWVFSLIKSIDSDVSDQNLDTALRDVPRRLRESR